MKPPPTPIPMLLETPRVMAAPLPIEAAPTPSYRLRLGRRKGVMSVLGHKQTFRSAIAMSALGQKQTCAVQTAMSALPPKADMCAATRDVRFVPIADSCTAANRICYSIISSTPIRGSLTTEASVVAVVAPSSRRTLARPFPEEAVLHDYARCAV